MEDGLNVGAGRGLTACMCAEEYASYCTTMATTAAWGGECEVARVYAVLHACMLNGCGCLQLMALAKVYSRPIKVGLFVL